MKLPLLLILLSSNMAFAGVVNGYLRHDGQYVAPYVRSEPDAIKEDNYSYHPQTYSPPEYHSMPSNNTYSTPSTSINLPSFPSYKHFDNDDGTRVGEND